MAKKATGIRVRHGKPEPAKMGIGADAALARLEHGKHYRVHFANGHSAEIEGTAVLNGAPVNWPETVSVDEILPGPSEA